MSGLGVVGSGSPSGASLRALRVIARISLVVGFRIEVLERARCRFRGRVFSEEPLGSGFEDLDTDVFARVAAEVAQFAVGDGLPVTPDSQGDER